MDKAKGKQTYNYQIKDRGSCMRSLFNPIAESDWMLWDSLLCINQDEEFVCPSNLRQFFPVSNYLKLIINWIV